ncbi:hypothetical protein F0L68_28245 [Solihabitans fulvus]|uniref:Uncharacterized protein n=1 Tax=Solihabitans fulvus TaxID=1892852 RepID=A0A5B2WX54_9PSEU|nr:hypothetical protein [Solihabitans fulvus]KAA2255460.1 hypothetical protein F0L68_28245 [Solihabitans fulvus]
MSPKLVRFLTFGIMTALLVSLALVRDAAVGGADQAAAATQAHSSTARFYVTLYGFVDNSPPSAIISNPVIHSKAGGTGTYKDPVTFATDTREEKPGTIVYYAYLKKYFIMEDTCTECSKDWSGGGNGDNPVPPRNGHRWRIDLWAGGDKSSLHEPDKSALLDCENALTQDAGGDVTLNPPSTLTVDTTPIYNKQTRQCYTP